MKRIIAILAFSLVALAGHGQALPSGSVPFGTMLWLAPDGSVWTGSGNNGFKKLSRETLQEVTSAGATTNTGIIISGGPPTGEWDNNMLLYKTDRGVIAYYDPDVKTYINLGADTAVLGIYEGAQLKMFMEGTEGRVSTESRVSGLPAENGDEFVTLDQMNAGGSVDWNSIAGKPSAFPPEFHTHDASQIVSGTLTNGRIPTLPASKITSGIFAPDRLPIATASALGGVRVGTGLEINPTTGTLSWQNPDGMLAYIGEITWTQFATPNGAVHPLSVGYYKLTVSADEEAGIGVSYQGPKRGNYIMTVYGDHDGAGSETGTGVVYLKHMTLGWQYSVYHDFGGNIRIYPLNSGETTRMFAGEKQTVGTGEETLWDIPLTDQLWYGDLLTHNGDRIEVEYTGSFLSATGDKTIRVRVGDDVAPTSVFSHTFTAGSTMWSLRVVATRTGPTTVDVEGYLRWGTGINEMYQLLSSSTDAPFEVIRLTAQSSNPIQLLTGRATYYPYFGTIDTN